MEKNKKNVPKIRFKGFTEKWEEKEFSNTFLFLNNNTLSRAELNYESGSTKNVHYGDVLIKFGECLDISKEELPYITNEKIAHLQDGDIIIADAAEDETVGKCTELLNVNEQVVAGLHTIACRPLLSFANRYLGYLLNASVFHNQLLPLMQGTKIVGISKSAIKDTLIYYPEFNEQTQIGNYFQNIDKLIEAKQSRIDKLKNIKKACLEKMFPKKGATTPEIRFKGFSGEWEENTIGEASFVYDGTHQTPKYTNSGIMFLSVENIKSLKSNKFISLNDYKQNFKTYPENGDVLMTRIGDIGTANVVETDQPIAYYVSLALLKKKELYPYFFKELIHSNEVQNRLWHRTLHIAFPKKINKNEIEKVEITHPFNFEEQQQIGDFLKNLDKLISQNEQQLTKLKNIKKACLEKMFVNKEDVL